MRRLIALLVACGAAACTDPVSNQADRPVALRGLTVIDGTGGPAHGGQTILIENGLIVAVGADEAVTLPAGAEVLDMTGRWAVPGFVDVHAHMPAPEHQSAVLHTLLAFGVTTARSTAAVPVTGVELRARLERGDLIGPRFLTAGRLIDAPGSPWDFAAEVATAAEARAEVARQAAEGVDFVKLYSQLPPAVVAAAIDEAHARGVDVIGHLGRTGWAEAAELGIDALAHSFVLGFAHSAVPESHAEEFSEFFVPNPGFDPGLFSDWTAAIDFDAPRFQALVSALTEHRVALDPPRKR